MKSILITGFNRAQTCKDYFLSQRLQIPTSHYGLIRALEDMGHEVEQRPVEMGENLDQYDEVVLYLHSPRSFSQRLYSALYVAGVRDDAIYSIDDWQADQIFKGISEMLEKDFIQGSPDPYRQYLFDVYQGTETVEEVKKYESVLIQGLKRILSGKNRFLLPAFSNGDPRRMRIKWSENFHTFDPTPYHYHRTPENGFRISEMSELLGSDRVEPVDKKTRWVFSSLMQSKTRAWLKKQRILKWDVDYYGVQRGPLKCPRLTEGEMCRTYMENWGCLAPGYYHAGSGFWRPRALQIADAGSIMVCDDAEGRVYSEAHVGVRASDVERMDVSQLTKLAKDQRDGFYDTHRMDKADTKAELQRVLEAPRT